MKKICLFLLITFISFAGYAQLAASYTFSAVSGTYTSISGSGTVAPGLNGDDNTQTTISLGFNFVYCGTTYMQLSACSNGWLSLSNNGGTAYANATAGGMAGSGLGILMPLFDDGDNGSLAGTAYYQTTGSSGSKVFTFEWKNWPGHGFTGYTGNANYQVKLYEGSNIIEFIYASSPTVTGQTSTIGIANSAGDFQTLTDPGASPSSTTSWNGNITSYPANGQIYRYSLCGPVISGNTPMCLGSSITLTSSLGGGTWSSGSTGVATIGTSGVVTSVSPGTSVISYTALCGTTVTTTVTVNGIPAAPSGNSPLTPCATITLTDATGTGTWSSSNAGVATAVSGTGVVTGVSAGTATVTFTLTSTGCRNTATIVTVNALPAITGSPTLCIGLTSALAHSVSGGTWSSSSAAVATVGTGGVITGVSANTATITYTVPGGCIVTIPITVNPQPGTISAPSSICGSLTTTLTDGTSGGVWSTSSSSLATIGSSTGVITGGAAGVVTVFYTLPTTCVTSTTITVNALSAISGAPTMCMGGTTTLSDATSGGVWSSSSTSVATIGTSGLVTAVALGTTTISYAIASTGCTATITAYVTTTPSGSFTVSGGGSRCPGGSGVLITLSGSNLGVSYQLMNGAVPVGAAIIGSGLPIPFPLDTAAGTYTVIANRGSTCETTMTGSAVVTVFAMPTAYTISGGGGVCPGGTGVHIFLSSSTIGVNYQLYRTGGVPVGTPVSGTGAPLDFGVFTTGGVYTVIATNTTTGCTNNMAASATITVNSLPAPGTVTPVGGGGYCTGSGGSVVVGLNGSVVGDSYQLRLSGSPVGTAVAGTGSPITFGPQTTPGTYTVLATTTVTGCSAVMSGSTIVTVNPLPSVFTITGGGNYCVGGSGVSLGQNGSTVGVNYRLWKDGVFYVPTTIVAGTGAAISFGSAFTNTGSYTVVATNPSTGCVSNMAGSVAIGTNPLPAPATVTGGGTICAGAPGMAVGLGSSVVGINYQLILNGGGFVGAAAGTGFPLSFGLQTGSGTYTVLATIAATGCSVTFPTSVNITVNPLPSPFSVTVNSVVGGSGSYCAGGTGVVVGLNGSTSGITYQLYNSGTPVGGGTSGTGSALNFGLQTLAGAYTVIATSGPGCSSNMTGSGSISINPLPVIYSVTGGGGYCTGTVTGVHIGLAASNVGINYQLQNGGPIGAPVPGAGSALDFGTFTGTGTYTVQATNTITGCTSSMSGSAIVTVNALPAVFAMSSNGSYCLGGTGVPVSLGGSATGITYQLYRDGSPVSALAGTGLALSFGNQTIAGTYTVIATNPLTSCSSNMAGSTTVSINPLPTVYTVTGGGSYCAGGTGVNVGLSSSTVGTSYQLYRGFVSVGLPVAGNGAAISFGPQTATGNYTVVATSPSSCSVNMSGTVVVSITPLPTQYTVTGGGPYCTGGTGVHIGLSGSNIGINYQMYTLGLPIGPVMAGTGFPIDFGLQPTAGVYTVVGTNAALGCLTGMTGFATVTISTIPALYSVTGGGNHCPDGAGVPINLNGSATGVSYQLYLGPVPTGSPVAGTGFGITFGLQTAVGNYTVTAYNGCTRQMTSSAVVGLFPVPIVYNVIGGGNYCPGGTGVNVGTDGSTSGNTYQLSVDGVPTGSPVAGTGLPISFGLRTVTGSYTVKALNPTTGCSSTMAGSAAVGFSPLPATFAVTGGGSYCQGAGGLIVGLGGSEMFTSYQLFRGVASVGPSVTGTGSALNFGTQFIAGNYTVVATSGATTCANPMTGSVAIAINPLPTLHTVTGGGNYCSGGTGVNVGLNASDAGIIYQLYHAAIPTGPTVAGTGAAITFGPQLLPGVYTVVATNSTTSCMNNMTGSVTVTTTGLPTAYAVTGGGNYCPGGIGVAVGTSGSNTGISYQLLNNGVPLGAPVAGTGLPMAFGLQTLTGTYKVVATNTATGCTNNMTDSVIVGINSLPAGYSIYGAHSNYCVGGVGVPLTLSGSEWGVNYQLYVDGVLTGAPFAGSGSILSLGMQTAAGNYTVVATNTTTTCSSVMPGSFSVAVDPLPAAYGVVGGGDYCSGGAGVIVGLANSHVGINYQLYNDLGMVGTAQPGTGSPVSFGNQTAAGNYTVIATNPASSCTSNMTGSATVVIDPLPALYTVTGGGNYCAGSGGLHVGLSGSNTGITYQLYKDGSLMVGGSTPGTGSALDFGIQTATGSYTVVAANIATGCIAPMTGTVVIGINPLPAAFVVSGGGNYCAGGDGVHVGLLGSALGVSYQLYNGALSSGAPMAGTGSALDFGLKTAAGNYTVVATNAITMCMNNMSGSVVIGVNAAPNAHSVTGGGNYCAGTDGVHIGLDGSNSDIQYQLLSGIGPVGFPLAGTGSALDFGIFSDTGSYTVVATNTTTGCTGTMTGSAVVGVTLLVAPSITLSSTAVGDTLCAGSLVTVTALVSNQGSAPVYNWTVNGFPASATGTGYTYTPANGDVVVATLTSSAACATPPTVSSSLHLTVLPNGAPAITISANPGTTVCQGAVVNFSTTSLAFGGTAPSFSWMVNGTSQSNDDHYSYIPGNGDNVYVTMNSNYRCRLAVSATSNHIFMNVDVPVIPDVTVTAHPGANFAMGQAVLLSATLNNIVTAPTYQWFVNGSAMFGATMATFSGNNFNNNDSVSCVVTSGGTCAGNTGSDVVVLHTGNVSVKQIAATSGDITLIPNPNKGLFTVKGTLGNTDDQQVSLEITNLLGQVIYANKVVAHGGNINEKIQLSNIANGMYILNLHSESESKVFHIVVEQ